MGERMAVFIKRNADDLDKPAVLIAHKRYFDSPGFSVPVHDGCTSPTRMKIVVQ
jgi:hypothetical protein